MGILFASLSYFLGAFSVILDKFLLGSKRISSPVIYSFYVAILGLLAIFLIPFFGFYIPSFSQIILSLIAGAFFTFGILALYFAIQRSEASRVTPIVGAVTPIGTLFLAAILGGKFDVFSILGIAFLIFGGLLISFDLPLRINPGPLEHFIGSAEKNFIYRLFFKPFLNFSKKFTLRTRRIISGFYPSVLAGLFLAIAYFLFKFVYNEQTFINGFIWTRIGGFLATASFLIIPKWRKEILENLRNLKKPKKENYQTGGIFILNKAIGGTSSLLLNMAIMLGSVTLINSLVSTQYVFVLVLAWIFSRKYPKVFNESLSFWDWAQKIGAIIIIGIGIIFISK
jgi:drug/metabolite transporter (DMT)-like permease